MTHRIKTLCLFCGEEIDRIQYKKGKAICEDCDDSVINSVPKKELGEVESFKKKRKLDEEKFMKVMKTLFRKNYV